MGRQKPMIHGRLKKGIILLFLCMPALLTSGCHRSDAGTTREFFEMDTIISITVYSDDDQLEKMAADMAKEEFSRIARISDRFSAESEISRVNADAGIRPTAVGADLYNMVKASLFWAQKTDGAFNIALGPVSDLWGFSSGRARVPEQSEIDRALALCSLSLITLDNEASTVFLETKGMSIDLGAVAKGYATERAAEKLEELGIKSALINAGGNIYVVGKKPDGTRWRIGIQHPEESNEIIGYLDTEDMAAITSGNNQRYFIKDGARYHHIIDPSTGWPSDALSQVTVVSSSAMTADILSTSFFVAGNEKINEIIKDIPEVFSVYTVKNDEIFAFGQSESFNINRQSGYRMS